MEPDYGWLEGLERENLDALRDLFRELKSQQERAAGPGPAMISDMGPTVDDFMPNFDMIQPLKEDRARWLVTLIYRGFVDRAEHDPAREAFVVDADAEVVRHAISVLMGVPAGQMPARSVPAHGNVGQAMSEVAKGALKRFGERAADMAMRIGPHLMRLFMDWLAHHPGG